ncbi:hypothetical protein [Persicitalea sp.]|uniref:hypothetical protein n=1 Tax=Persicitalea sp. TaxID=3100273 RepID=UPI0035941FDD
MISWLFSKISGFFVRVRYTSVEGGIRAYYKTTVVCKLTQLKYVWRDYVSKRPYKELDFSGEFAPELQFALPFAYWHYKNGTLKSTVSSLHTKEMYFFSPQHQEKHLTRTDQGNFNYEMPRVLYSQDYDLSKWEQVPLKVRFRNSVYVFDKPVVVVANRYNSEWDGAPVSYLGIDLLDFLFTQLKTRYTILYNRPRPQNITMDNSDVYDLNEIGWIKEMHPEVVLMDDLYKENKANANNFNHFQFLVYANTDRFVSVHGGTATLASYFGGINIILSKRGPEHHFGCYEKLYPQFSGATILHATTDEKVMEYVQRHYLNFEAPTL